MTLRKYRNATAQMLSNRCTISTAPLGRPFSNVTAKTRYSEPLDEEGITLAMLGPGPRSKAFLVSSGTGVDAALPYAAAFSTNCPCESCQKRTPRMLGRDPLNRLAARVTLSVSCDPISVMC